MPTPSWPYTLSSRSRQTHKPELAKEYVCPTHGGKPKQSATKGKKERHTTRAKKTQGFGGIRKLRASG